MNQLVEATLADLIHRIETGTGNWLKDWIGGGSPRNFMTKRHYHGVNILLLWAAAKPTRHWGTYKQWQGAGYQVRQGEKSTVIFISKDAVKRGGDPANDQDHYRLLKCAFVFNSSQLVEPPVEPAMPFTAPERHDACEATIAATGAKFIDGVDPAYSKDRDVIRMPGIGMFTSAEGYYATAFHELVHWTGHGDRLARDMDPAHYAYEELIAELGAAFLCAQHGITDQNENAAAYLRNWLSSIKDDKPKALMQAGSAASKAMEFVLACNVTREAEEVAA